VLIRKPRTTEHYEDKIGQVIREIDKMQLLLDRLLQLARLQSGAISPQKQSVSLYALLEALKTGMLKELIARQMNLLIDIQPDAAVMANVAFLEIMISNLLENSLKYGSENGYIYCTWDETARALTIADDGPGIPAEQVPFLFNQFYRADASRSSHVPGSGLGLSIVQKIAMLEHIAISVKSDVGKGMVLTLKFL
jgi:signal transduction histidine kinase